MSSVFPKDEHAYLPLATIARQGKQPAKIECASDRLQFLFHCEGSIRAVTPLKLLIYSFSRSIAPSVNFPNTLSTFAIVLSQTITLL